MVKQKLIRDDVLAEQDGQTRLVGGHCKKCGSYCFPKGAFCTSCLSEELETVTLSEKGELYSWTVVGMKSANFAPPHPLGMIDLPEGVRVVAPLEGDSFKVGAEMEFYADRLWIEPDGTEIIGYKFRETEAER